MADGTLRLIVDVEPRDAVAAFGLFGQPGTAMALAALKPGATPEPEPEKPKGGALSILAARWCQSLEFVEFIRPIYDRVMGGDGSGYGDVTPVDFEHKPGGNKYELYSAHCIRVICNCEKSRSELDHDPRKAELFQRLIRGPFIKYMASLGIKEPTPRPTSRVRFTAPEEAAG
jgi:hypothetical protein